MAIAAAMLIAFASAAEAKNDHVLYSFAGGNGDGARPLAGLFTDAQGNFYGTTANGGSENECDQVGGYGCGTVFKLAPDGTETVLYVFSGGADGSAPHSRPVMDAAGNLYGTTFLGGTGTGVIFKISPAGKESVLYTFQGGNDGGVLNAGVIFDDAGNLYGTTVYGGAAGQGTVFELTARGKFKTLYSFAGGSDGGQATSGLIRDGAGNLYGTTSEGGGVNCGVGCGTVFKLTPQGQETVLYAFQGGDHDGASPFGVTMDSKGTLYGTTLFGGLDCDSYHYGCGTAYKLTAKGEETVLHFFTGGSNGANPMSGLLMDESGALYGSTEEGGDPACNCGTVYKLSHRGKETVLHTFGAGSDGRIPYSGLFMDAAGNLFGTTETGGTTGSGTVFEIAR
ncbi:MAG TPA: choice-of-anchor tandem repeat GloVer-containing protein [Rhizomicrobium sp.]|nr:choice-of-anchor tandem repeat GloVer-containing protein [Rhizomicrobium sp.]